MPKVSSQNPGNRTLVDRWIQRFTNGHLISMAKGGDPIARGVGRASVGVATGATASRSMRPMARFTFWGVLRLRLSSCCPRAPR